jgi:hypothetical protein
MTKHQILNSVYSSRRMKRRYEVWFLRCGLADGSGAWWFRYLLLNLGHDGCSADPSGLPVQIWATWFPRQAKPQTFVQGYSAAALELSGRRQLPFFLRIAENGIEENTCWGNLHVDGHSISWKLRYRSTFGVVLSDKGWIGFSKSPHSDAVFSGEIAFDGQRFSGDPLGAGVQGHNCGYRHRTYWRWMHAYFAGSQGTASTLEALVYDMPLGMAFRKVVWWHRGKPILLRGIQETTIVNNADKLAWTFSGITPDGSRVEAVVEGSAPEVHHLPYLKTDCSGTFPVANASLARAQIRFGKGGNEILETATGAVLEMGGN